MATKSRAYSWSRIHLPRNFQTSSLLFCRNISTVPHFPVSRSSLLCNDVLTDAKPLFLRKILSFSHFPSNQTLNSSSRRAYCSAEEFSPSQVSGIIQNLLGDVEKEKQREREERKRAGLDTKDIDEEDEEDYLGIGPLIEKLEKKNQKETGDLNQWEEASDSDSDVDDESAEAEEERRELFEMKFERHKELVENFVEAETLDDAFKCMKKLDKFEKKHFNVRPEYRVIGALLDRLKVAEGKEKFILQQKLNRAMRLAEWKEEFDPNNPSNYGIIKAEDDNPSPSDEEDSDEDEDDDEAAPDQNNDTDSDEEEFDDMKERDDILLEKLNAIDKKLEEKLAELDHTFGKKGKRMEEEIRNLAEERNELTEQKRLPLYRKGFDVRTIDVNRTNKVTKGGQVTKYTAMLVCGNYEGVIGFAKAKGPNPAVAMHKAYEKCFQNLHFVERHEEHTIAHAVQTSYKKTKVYLWPASTTTGMKAGRIVQTILNLAGFKNVKSKVIGSRNPHNTVKAVLQALNAIETPKDVQEKFGRTVVEKYLL